jgi:hypothetical protein
VMQSVLESTTSGHVEVASTCERPTPLPVATLPLRREP